MLFSFFQNKNKKKQNLSSDFSKGKSLISWDDADDSSTNNRNNVKTKSLSAGWDEWDNNSLSKSKFFLNEHE